MTNTCFGFVYARSDSTRLPGKVLTSIGDDILIDIVFERMKEVRLDGYVLLTTNRAVDDDLALYCEKKGYYVIRGHSSDLVSRTMMAIEELGADWFLRINADSPLLEPTLIEFALRHRKKQVDFISNLFTRNFPYGVSVELIKASSYKHIAKLARLEEREHVTQHMYRCIEKLNFLSISNLQSSSLPLQLTIDTPEHLSYFRKQAEVFDLKSVKYWEFTNIHPPKFLIM